MISRLPRLLAALSLLQAPVLAQDKEPVIQTELATIALGNVVGDLFYRSGDEIRPFFAKAGNLGIPERYKGPEVFVLHDQESDFASQGKDQPAPEPVAAVRLPRGADRVLLICRKSDDGVQLKAVDISHSGQKGGDYRFFNYATETVAIVLGGKRFTLETGEQRILSDGTWRSEVMDMPIEIFVARDAKPKLVYSTAWGHRPGQRHMIFLFDGSRANRPIMTSRFYDYPKREAATAP